jgi:hypothetical protein
MAGIESGREKNMERGIEWKRFDGAFPFVGSSLSISQEAARCVQKEMTGDAKNTLVNEWERMQKDTTSYLGVTLNTMQESLFPASQEGFRAGAALTVSLFQQANMLPTVSEKDVYSYFEESQREGESLSYGARRERILIEYGDTVFIDELEMYSRLYPDCEDYFYFGATEAYLMVRRSNEAARVKSRFDKE